MSATVGVLALLDRAYTALYVAAEDEEGMALAEDVLQAGAAIASLLEAVGRTLADVDAPGHTVRSIRAESVAALRTARACCGGAPR
jgi:hypothetical protein